MTPVQTTERTLVGFYEHLASLGLGPLSDVELKCCEAVVAGRCRVRAGLEQLFEVGFQAAISLEEYL